MSNVVEAQALPVEAEKVPVIRIRAIANGVVEEIPLPFRIPVKTWKGKLPVKETLRLLALPVGFLAWMTGVVFMNEAIFGLSAAANKQGSPSFYVGMGAFILGLLVILAFLTPLGEQFERVRDHDRFERRQKFLDDTLQPWLESVMGFTNEKDARFAGYDLTNKRKDSWSTSTNHLDENTNKLGAFNLELSMHGFRLRRQYLRVWRWDVVEGE